MKTWLTISVLCLASLACAQTVIITGKVLDATGKAYQNGSGVVTLVPQNVNWLVNNTNPVSSPVRISGLDSFGGFTISLTNTSLIQPASMGPQWQFSFCSQTYASQAQQVCFTMTPMSLTTSQDISTQIQAQSALLPTLGSSLTLQTNGVPNGSQSLLNLVSGTGVTLTDNGSGSVTIGATAGLSGSGVSGQIPVWNGTSSLTGFSHLTYNDTFANSPTTFAAAIVGDNTTLGAFCLPSPGTGNTQCIAASSATAPRADFTLPNATGAYGANIIDVGVGTGLDQNANGTVQLQVQYRTVTCPAGLGDGLNAIPAATYPIFDCVNKLISNRIIARISCYTDNAGSSTLSATNNAGSALLTGPVTCNNTKAGGGASGTLSGATTIVPGDAVNFSFISDGASKTTTWTVVMSE